ncbi:unnamed protein product [Symbiodinium necroappetens]|uniref:Uncharacterized protein n=1 Tax=Symbiodinium necroappetens TaxID=1628268 RepID=A0A812KQX9_9DINO|nr:unnamed protein product [Symbiodinium necroappetens]
MIFACATDNQGVEKPSGDKESRRKKSDKKKEKAKKRKKGKKSSSSSQSSSGEESETEPSQDGFEDAAATFGLGKRDMSRSMELATLVDLDARPTALVLSKITPLVIANDIFEMGGELESLLRDRSMTAKKSRAKKEQEDALFQMKTAATVWKRRKYPGGKDAWGKALEDMLKESREAASDDLKQQIKKVEKPRKGRDPHAKAAKETKKHAEPEPEASDLDKDGPEESLPSPSAAPYVDSPSEQEDGDDDVFQGEFKLPSEKEGGLDALLAKVASKVKDVADGFERSVLESLPGDLSPADFSYWLLCLDKEALTQMEHFNLGIQGALSGNLGPGKSFFMKMSLRARKTFDDWASKIPGVISAPPTASAARSLHYCIVLGTIYKSLQLTPAPQGTTNLDAVTTPDDRESHVLRATGCCENAAVEFCALSPDMLPVSDQVMALTETRGMNTRTNATMAAASWIEGRIEKLQMLLQDEEREDLRKNIQKKIEWVDACFTSNRPLGTLDVSPPVWEEALTSFRARAASCGLWFRPRIFGADAPAAANDNAQAAEAAASDSSCSPGQDYHNFETLYLSCHKAVKGILQLHKVTEDIQGYRMLFRVEELWSLAKRQQHFHNFFSLSYLNNKEGLVMDVCESWKVDLINFHCIRKASYKGQNSKLNPARLRLPFDGLTVPGAIFMASYVLQSRGCKEEMQATALTTLDVILGTSVVESLRLPLIPGNEACRLQIHDGHVSLASWQAFLEYANLTQRWQSCKILSKEEQSVDTGLRLALVVWNGRRLKLECKPKSEMAISRFLSRGGGFCSSQADASLKEVGLESLCPTHYNRTTADFVHRYLCKTQAKVQQVLSGLKNKSIALICDASPKAKHDESSDKLAVAAMVADSHTKAVLGEQTKPQDKKKLPKALNALKEDRLSAKQELKAVANVLSHIGLSLDQLFPTSPCIAVDPDTEERRLHAVGDEVMGYVVNRETGISRWDTHMPDEALRRFIRDELHKIHAHMGRVTSCSPIIKRMTLLSGWLFRAKKSPWGTSNVASTLKEAQPDDVLMELFSRDILKENDLPFTSDAKLNFQRTVDILGKTIKYNSESFSWSRWCSWAHTAAHFQMSSTLLLILWSSIEVGKNPLNMEALQKESESSQMALHKFTLRANTDELEMTISALASECLSLKVLDMAPDVAINGQGLDVKFRRCCTFQTVLSESLGMYLCAAQEFLEHFLYLRSSPSKAAALIAPDSQPETKRLILSQMKAEWEMILRLEKSPAKAAELHEHCRYVGYQAYRELLAGWEKHQWKEHPEALSLTLSYFPEVAWSSNIESLFKEMTTAVKRSGQSDVGSLPNLMAVAIRGLHRRLCIGEDTPTPLSLEKGDWTGPQASFLRPKIFNPTSAVPCQNFCFDSICKPFPSTSAFHHNHHSLNFMSGLMLADSMGRDPAAEIPHFWVPETIFAGMLFKRGDGYFLSLGRTPAILNALQLKQLPWTFTGPLPAEEKDETRIPASDVIADDVLSASESNPALTLDSGRHLVCKLLVKADEVRFYDYTIHLSDQSLAEKCGSSLVLRRGTKSFSLMPFLVEKGFILKLTVANLMDFLASCGIRMPKNSTKAARIRRVLQMDCITQECSPDKIRAILEVLDKQEEKRRKRGETQNEPSDEAEIHWEELEEDAAAVACRELLVGMGDGDDDDVPSGGEGEGDDCLSIAPKTPAATIARPSRAALSSTTSIPAELLQEMPLPDGTSAHMITHKDRTLPHFQGRLLSGELFDGKRLGCK